MVLVQVRHVGRVFVECCLTSYSNRYLLLLSLARRSSGKLVSEHVPTTRPICCLLTYTYSVTTSSKFMLPKSDHHQLMNHIDIDSLQLLQILSGLGGVGWTGVTSEPGCYLGSQGRGEGVNYWTEPYGRSLIDEVYGVEI